jgi:hypothetical protein
LLVPRMYFASRLALEPRSYKKRECYPSYDIAHLS